MFLVLISAAPATQPDLPTPQSAARAYYDALFSGDWTTLEAVTVNDAASSAWLKATQQGIVATEGPGAAVRQKFGEGEVARFVPPSPRQAFLQDLPNVKVNVNGDRATLEWHPTPRSRQILKFTKAGDAWKYDGRDPGDPPRARMTQEILEDRVGKNQATHATC
jgi:hypothetical protein